MLRTLELTNFKSYKNGLFGFEPGVNIIVGANASGKTNLLEAIHTICTLKGFKTSDKNLTSIDSDWSRLEALTISGSRIAKLKDNSKILEIDGSTYKRINANNLWPVIVFEPDHMLLLSSDPERRRSYLDGILALIDPKYPQALKSYKRTLLQRNRLLKQERFNEDQLFVWDIQLAQKAGIISNSRANLTKQLNEMSIKHYCLISNKKEHLKLKYISKFPLKDYTNQFLSYLKQNHILDKIRGFTGSGPHREDFDIILNNKDAKVTASRGETRSIILALKISELELVREKSGKKPILLLDDVFSELDGSRRRSLAIALQDYQTFLTTTDADIAIDYFSKSCNIIPL